MNAKPAVKIAAVVAVSAAIIHQAMKPSQRPGESEMDYLRRIKAVRR